MTMYFMPAFLASFAQASAGQRLGLKVSASFSYSPTGMRSRFITHSDRSS